MQLKLGARYAVSDVGHVVEVAKADDASTLDASKIM
jgi:hypothetical protein